MQLVLSTGCASRRRRPCVGGVFFRTARSFTGIPRRCTPHSCPIPDRPRGHVHVTTTTRRERRAGVGCLLVVLLLLARRRGVRSSIEPGPLLRGGACVRRCGGTSRPKEGTGPAPWRAMGSAGSRGLEGPWQSPRRAVVYFIFIFLITSRSGEMNPQRPSTPHHNAPLQLPPPPRSRRCLANPAASRGAATTAVAGRSAHAAARGAGRSRSRSRSQRRDRPARGVVATRRV